LLASRRESAGVAESFNEAGEVEDFEVRGVVGPVVAPADDHVAAGGGVVVFAEVFALKFKFDADVLPAGGTDLAFGFAIGKACLNGFDHVAQIFGQHTEEKDDPLFIERLVA
jgi:hypothetical protein